MTDSWRRLVRFTLAALVTTSLLVVAGVHSVSAGSAAQPEILDPAGDVSPAAFYTETAANQSVFANATAYDVVRAWVGLESAKDFMIFIQVRDLPDDWGHFGDPPEASPFGVNTSFAGTSLVANFSVAGRTYEAIAKLAQLGPHGLFDNYTLWSPEAGSVAVSGAYNTTQDLVVIKLPKAKIQGLQDNVRLTKFWVLGRFDGRPMDFAPNAKDPSFPPVLDPQALARKIARGHEVEPQYGADYVFGDYYHPPVTRSTSPFPWPTGSSAPGHVPAIALSIVGSEHRIIASGETATYDVRVRNDADAADTVYFTLNSASPGWQHVLDQTSLDLEPGDERLLRLSVAAGSDAEGTMVSTIDASSVLGASTRAHALTGTSGDDLPPGTTTSQVVIVAAPPDRREETPAPAALAVVAALLVAALRGRRGTH